MAIAGQVLNGGADNDGLRGGDGDDTLNGNAGHDRLDGGAGDDRLVGGADNDTLVGGAGNDTYVFGRGDGQDVIAYDDAPSAGQHNALEFAADVLPGDVLLARQGSRLVFSIAGTADSVSFEYYTYGDPTDPDIPLHQVRFADGTIWDVTALASRILAQVFAGTAAADRIAGTIAADTITGQDGADYLYGLEGDDLLDGGAGRDVLAGGNGRDILNGGADTDTLYGEAGNDTLDGGTGNDTLFGGTGNDVILFGRGDGQDTIGPDYEQVADKLNVLQFKQGVDPAEIVATRTGSDLVLSIANTADRITISSFFYGEDPTSQFNPIQEVRFANGARWDLAALAAKASNKAIEGTAGADKLVGTAFADALFGQAGDDSLSGGDGNDILDGGAGDDTLHGDGGADTLSGGPGDDRLYGGAGNDTYLFDKGDGHDTIGADFERGPGKFNVLQFGDSVDPARIIAMRSGSNLILSIAGATDTIDLVGIFVSDDTANPANPIQQVRFADGTRWSIKELTDRAFAGTTANDTLRGTVAADSMNGRDGADTLYGGNGNDALNGGAGGDVLYGEGGADTLDGGTGNDTLSGGAGNDTYLFGRGDGRDVIEPDSDAGADKLNILRFKAGVAPEDIVATRSGSDLILSIAGTNDAVAVRSFFYADDAKNSLNPIQQVSFSDDPTRWDVTKLIDKVFAGTSNDDVIRGTTAGDSIAGQAGADRLFGNAGDDTLSGNEGNDTLYGNDGDDTLDGGTGNDVLSGGSGNDTVLFGRGDGQDFILAEYAGISGELNVLQFKAGVTPGDIVAARSHDDLVLSVSGTNDRVTIGSFFDGDDPANAYNPIQQVNFADGTQWDVAALVKKTLAGTDGADHIVGTLAAEQIDGRAGDDDLYGQAGDDAISGGLGADHLYGGDGSDTLTGGSDDDHLDGGDGNDLLFGDDGNDVLRGGAGADWLNGGNGDDILDGGTGDDAVNGGAGADDLYGGAGNDSLQGGIGDDRLYGGDGIDRLDGGLGNDDLDGAAGADFLYGSTGDDTLRGGAGDDLLSGGTGNDTLDGGAGNDELLGGSGNDTYRFSLGSGSDTIDDYDTTSGNSDIVIFGNDIRPDQLWFRQTGDNLEVSVIGTQDRLTIRNWYSDSASHVERFLIHGAPPLVERQVQILVEAMAGFSPPAALQTTLASSDRSAPETLLAAR